MSSDSPVPHDSSSLVPASGQAPAVIETLPASRTVADSEVRALALREGYCATAVDLARHEGQWTVGHRLRTLMLAVPFALAVLWFFPSERFFKAPLRPLADSALGELLTTAQVEAAGSESRPMLEVRRNMERLAVDGDMPAAIELAESELSRVPLAERKAWSEVYYRYWEYLERSVLHRRLERSVRQFISINRDDPVFAWYFARIYNRKIRLNLLDTTGESMHVLQWLDAAVNRLNYQAGNGDGPKDLDLRRHQLLLEKAWVHWGLWKFHGYPETGNTGVNHRDELIRLCTGPLAGHLDAQRLLLRSYDQVLERWWWFEGSETIAGDVMTRNDLRQKRHRIREAIEQAEHGEAS